MHRRDHAGLVLRRSSPEAYRASPESIVKRSLIDGILIEEPGVSDFHQAISWNLSTALAAVVRRRLGTIRYAPFDVWLDGQTAVQPDLLFVAKRREGIIEPQGVRGPPDLVVEILSPSTSRFDRIRKRALYAQHGVRELWLIDPALCRVEVFRFRHDPKHPVAELGEGDSLRSPLLPGWKMRISDLFVRRH